MPSLIRRNQGQETAPTTGAAWDPFRVMRDMLRWDPFRELEGAVGGDYGLFAPSFDVKETKEGYVFRADLPGVREEDLEISLTGNRLAISGHREQEKREQGETYYASERSYGAFSRAFTLPEGTDAITSWRRSPRTPRSAHPTGRGTGAPARACATSRTSSGPRGCRSSGS